MRWLLIVLVFFPLSSEAAPRTFAELADFATNIINGGIGVALILGIVVFFYGMTWSVVETNQGKFDRLREQILWGIIALFVMFSVWGITGLLRNTLFGSGAMNFGGKSQVLCTSLDDCVTE